MLEEDIALTNVGLDLLGQARLWLAYARRSRGATRARAQRGPARVPARRAASFATCSSSSSRTATTPTRWRASSCSTIGTCCCCARSRSRRDARIAEIAAKAVKEVAYHVERSTDWVIRLGDGTEESHARMQAALDDLWPYTGEMFAADAVELRADRRRRRGRRRARCSAPWLAAVDAVLAEATLTCRPANGCRRGDAAASRACTPSTSAGCSPRCSSCSARIRARMVMATAEQRRSPRRPRGRRGAADQPRRPRARVGRARRRARSGDPGGVDRRARHRARRRVRRRDGVARRVTPTYSGCPATDVITTIDSRGAGRDRACATSRSSSRCRRRGRPTGSRRKARRKLAAFGIAPPQVAAAPRIDVAGISPLRRTGVVVPCPRCGSTRDALLVAVRLDRVQGATTAATTCREPFDYFKPH